MKVRLLENKILIEVEKAPETTASGLYIPETGREKPTEGVVTAVGPGLLVDGKRVEMTVKVGDRVMYSKFAGTELEYDGKNYVLMNETAINFIL